MSGMMYKPSQLGDSHPSLHPKKQFPVSLLQLGALELQFEHLLLQFSP